VFTQGYRDAGFEVSADMIQVLFSEMAAAYLLMTNQRSAATIQ
jgi:hypothetical protein